MMKHKLPSNWIVLHSKTHPDRVYYFNVKTNQSSWEEPTADQAEKVTRKSKKRKKLVEEDEIGPVEPTSPKCDIPEMEITKRKKLVAKKRSSLQIQETTEEEKETPQMKTIREKMLKKKEKNSKFCSSKSRKTVAASTSVKLDEVSSLTQKSDWDKSSNATYTPQMRVIREKLQDKTLKCNSKLKKSGQRRDSKIYKEEEPTKARLRNQVDTNAINILEFSPDMQSKKKKEEISNKTVESNIEKRRRDKECNFIEVASTKQNPTPLNKNLGKVRMEKLKKRITLQCEAAESSDNSKFEKADSSQESLTVISNPMKHSNEDSHHEDMDWEPLEHEKIMYEVQVVRTQLCTENCANMSHNLPPKTLGHPILFEHQEKKQLYIVIDTNVFLSNIEDIELARETTFKAYDRPFIVIPWTVIRELDYIKDDNGKTKPVALCGKARKAVSYINKLFSSKQPRVIGQTPEDVAKNREKFSGDCPDDEILQTCLHILDLGKSVVLLSYDVNLCNKAMIYDIITLGRNDPFEKVDYLNASNYVNETLSNSNTKNRRGFSLESSVILREDKCFANEVFEDTKSILRDFLTVIVSKEMHVLYGECWEKYVIIKPPWTTVTVLQCAIKHWMAAVSESFRRKAIFILKEFLQIFKNVSGQTSLQGNRRILDKCSDLIQMVRVNKHLHLVSRISKKVDELKEKCDNYESKIVEQNFQDIVGAEGNIEEQERRAQKAFQYFEAAYVFARDMCGLAAEAVKMPCSFHYNISNRLPSVHYVKQIQPELAANVNKLLCNLSAVIEQVKNSSTNYGMLTNLCETLITFIPDSAPAEVKLKDIDLLPLDIYCCIKLKEETLNRGLRQLQELSTHFCRLANYRCN